ncbi:MAG: hypothetical protein KC800_02525 [Candidatus Eremiobacteraeota bacterium]|nr:hypothetical protein [Candidatus Eremiobacteraeota bacterium]
MSTEIRNGKGPRPTRPATIAPSKPAAPARPPSPSRETPRSEQPAHKRDTTTVSREARRDVDRKLTWTKNLQANYDVVAGDDKKATREDLVRLTDKKSEGYLTDDALNSHIQKRDGKNYTPQELARERSKLRNSGRGLLNNEESLAGLDTAKDGGETDGHFSKQDLSSYRSKLQGASQLLGDQGEGRVHLRRVAQSWDLLSGDKDTINRDTFKNFSNVSEAEFRQRLLDRGVSEKQVDNEGWTSRIRERMERTAAYFDQNHSARRVLDNGAAFSSDPLGSSVGPLVPAGDNKIAVADAEGLRSSLDALLGSRLS